MTYPAFIEDKVYMDMDSSVSETEQLRAMVNNLTRIHLLTANQFDSLDALIKEYLNFGIEVFGLETGIVSEILEGGIYKICDVISPLDVFAKGQEFPLEDTYCREVAKSKLVLGFPEVGKLSYLSCHPVYQNLKLEAYLSAPIFVGEKFYGTLNFTSLTPRLRGFSIHEHNLIQLMAHSIGAFILLRNKEEGLLALNERMKRLVGYVAHDLRNPLGSIIGLAKLGMRAGASKETLQRYMACLVEPAEKALEFVATILENAALGCGKIILNKTPIDFKLLIEQAIESVGHLSSDSNVSINHNLAVSFKEQAVLVFGDASRLHQSLMNLLINAIKYSPANEKVTISAEIDAGHCVLTIHNHVALCAEQHSLLQNKVYGSVGFGLDIVAEVMKAHGCELKKIHGQQFYSVSFKLPIVDEMPL